jgi:hypothetical protein
MLKRTVLYFLILFLLLVVLPQLAGVFIYGGSRNGVPFTFHEYSSSPPPAFGSKFTAWAFAADLAIYFGIALLIAWARRRSQNLSGKES